MLSNKFKFVRNYSNYSAQYRARDIASFSLLSKFVLGGNMSSKFAYQLIPQEFLLGNREDQQEIMDLGEQIRKQVTKLTSLNSISDDKELTRQIDALERLSNNVYAKKYPRSYESTATGLTAAQCNQVLSSEFLQYLNEGSGSKKK